MNLDQKAVATNVKSTKKGRDKTQARLGQKIKKFIKQIDDIVVI